MKTKTFELPSYWASALINNDASGLSNTDETEMNNWLSNTKAWNCVDVSETTYIGRYNGLICDMATYSFI